MERINRIKKTKKTKKNRKKKGKKGEPCGIINKTIEATVDRYRTLNTDLGPDLKPKIPEYMYSDCNI